MNTNEETIFRVATFQGCIKERDPEASIEKTCQALQWADECNAHILCMPETYLQGYFDNREDAWANSIDLESSEFADLCSRFRNYNATLLMGLNERRGIHLYNTVVVIEQGELIGKYSKNYLCYSYFKRGLQFPVFEREGVKYGIIICADANYVEPARILAMRGAQVIFCPLFNRLPREITTEWLLRSRSNLIARAVENGCWVVSSDIIWSDDGENMALGCSSIVNEMGEFVCQAELLTEIILFYEIPKERLAKDTRKFWTRCHPEIFKTLQVEYEKLELEKSLVIYNPLSHPVEWVWKVISINMKLVKTVKCKLEVDGEQRQTILDTIAKFTQACNDALALARKNKLWNAYKLHYRCYYQLKERYGLHANYIVRAIGRVCAKRKHRPKSFKGTSLDLDARLFNFIEATEPPGISLATTKGRLKIKLAIGNFQRGLLKGQKPTIEGSNRNGQRFCCQKCGYENFADYISPFNIRQVYIDAGGWASVNTPLSSPAASPTSPTLGTASLAL